MTYALSIMEVFNGWAIPLLILVIVTTGAYKKVPVYESFVTGAKEGFGVAVMIIPYLVAMLFVIKVLVASELFADAAWLIAQGMHYVGLGAYSESVELLPLMLTRPLSGSGARALMVDLFQRHGTDSFIGNTASIMQGSTETTFYILTVYFGAINIKKLRHTLPSCLIADVAAMIAALLLGVLLYHSV